MRVLCVTTPIVPLRRIRRGWFASVLSLATVAALAQGGSAWAMTSRTLAEGRQQELMDKAWKGFQKGDPKPAQKALDQLRGSQFEPWLSYWSTAPRVASMSQAEFDAFARAHRDSYVLDRLRNDWLLELGKRADWTDFARVYPEFRMRDDAQVECYEQQRAFEVDHVDTSAAVLALWQQQKTGGPGCNSAARSLYKAGKLSDAQLWQRLRQFVRQGQPAAARNLADLLPLEARDALDNAVKLPAGLALVAIREGVPKDPLQRQLLLLALLRLAQQDPQQMLDWLHHDLAGLHDDERAEVAYAAAAAAAQSLSPMAADAYRQARAFDPGFKPDDISLQWQIRTALRSQDWDGVLNACNAMSAAEQAKPDWVYWKAQALQHSGQADAAKALWQGIANPWTYYGQLATEALGQTIQLPPPLPSATEQQVHEQAVRPALERALTLFRFKLYTPALREWNFNLRQLDDQQIHAAADLACQRQAWYLCIDASEHMKNAVDAQQRFVMPYAAQVKTAARDSDVDPALIYGLMRQESRFSSDIKSWVGANGLMQLMPATALWVARKIGMGHYVPARMVRVDTNVTLGSAYVAMLLQHFDGSQAMTAAGYNAGPRRPAQWRNMGLPAHASLPGAVFAENIPFLETRLYVKQVLANATVYAALLSGQPQSLVARLGTVTAAPGHDTDPVALP